MQLMVSGHGKATQTYIYRLFKFLRATCCRMMWQNIFILLALNWHMCSWCTLLRCAKARFHYIRFVRPLECHEWCVGAQAAGHVAASQW